MQDTSSNFLNLQNMNQAIIKAEYAVRGAMVLRAEEIKTKLALGQQIYPFDEVKECNIGNPQMLGQSPITFCRQVLSCLLSPELIETNIFPEGVRKRAKYYHENIKGNIGAYSQSPGYKFVRENVAKFIEKRDGGIPSNPEEIFLTEGASAGITMILSALLADKDCGIMLPLPQYPLYSATVALGRGKQVPYYLDEETGWQIKLPDLTQAYEEASKNGVKVRAIVVINPGNPTGQILEEDTMKEIVKFAYESGLCILADEVYQQNIWSETKKFVSFKKVVANMPEPYNKTPLFSFHSCSKGILGECGIRGGFLEIFNVDRGVDFQLKKLKTVSLCSNTVGQIMVDLLVNPPTEEENGKEVFEKYNQERDDILSSLKRKAKMVTKMMNSMKNVECQEVEGALYCFPKIKFSERAIQEAKQRNLAPDLFYCLQALEETGIVCVEGTGFGQKEGTYHLRTTILIRPDDKFEESLELFKKFNDNFHEKYR